MINDLATFIFDLLGIIFEPQIEKLEKNIKKKPNKALRIFLKILLYLVLIAIFLV